jgi:hypothetical protein
MAPTAAWERPVSIASKAAGGLYVAVMAGMGGVLVRLGHDALIRLTNPRRPE